MNEKLCTLYIYIMDNSLYSLTPLLSFVLYLILFLHRL